MSWRRLLAAGLVTSLLTLVAATALADVATSVYVDELKQGGITDVAADDWAAGDIATLVKAGVVQGDPTGAFRPGDKAKVSESVAIIARVLGIATKADSLAATMQKAVAAGLVSADQTSDPSRPMTRLEIAVLLGKALKITPKSVQGAGDVPFNDAGAVPSEQWGLLAALHDAGIFKGFPDGTFQPDGALTRAQIAALVNRIMARFGQH